MGDSEAHFPLGLCYMNGKGTEEDSEMAYHHFYEAHYSDDYDGTALLGFCYFFGIGTEQNQDKGIEFLNLAKNNGSDWGKYFLKQIKKRKRNQERNRKYYASRRKSLMLWSLWLLDSDPFWALH